MAAARIVEAFEVVEDRHARLGVGAPAAAIDQLALERGEERFGHRVIEAVAHAAHRWRDASLAAAPTKRQAGVLSAVVCVVDQSSSRLSIPQRHLEGIEYELGSEVVSHAPPDHPPTPHVDDHRQIIGSPATWAGR